MIPKPTPRPKVRKPNRPLKVRSDKRCEACGGEILSRELRARRRFCSRSCAARKPWGERLERYIKRTESGCWEWQGYRDVDGYGRTTIAGSPPTGAHRASYLFHKGAIPDGLMVCHHCDNPPCVNPDHLFLGTMSDNARDSIRKGRWPLRGAVLKRKTTLKAKPHRIPDAIREAVLDRAGRVCEWCHRPGGKLVVHHKLLRSQGGKDRVEDCAALHPLCHLAVHANPYDAQERGLIIGVGSNHR